MRELADVCTARTRHRIQTAPLEEGSEVERSASSLDPRLNLIERIAAFMAGAASISVLTSVNARGADGSAERGAGEGS